MSIDSRLLIKGKISPKNQLPLKRNPRNRKVKVRQIPVQPPWGAIQNGGFENNTLDPWYGSGILVTSNGYSGTNYCYLSGGLSRYIAQYTLPLDVSREYRLSFYVRRLTSATTGSVFVNYSAAGNFMDDTPLSTFRFEAGRRIWRQVIFDIPVPILGAQEPVIFIGLRDSIPSAAIAIDHVLLRPVIQIDPPNR